MSDPLSEREMMIAKEAAKIAIQELSNEFYRQVGKSVVTRLLIWVGVAAMAFMVGKGWVPKL